LTPDQSICLSTALGVKPPCHIIGSRFALVMCSCKLNSWTRRWVWLGWVTENGPVAASALPLTHTKTNRQIRESAVSSTRETN